MRDLRIAPMQIMHIMQVYKIESESFEMPWSLKAFSEELVNAMACYIVVVDDLDNVYGYAGMWHIINEGHITNIAVAKKHRGRGVGRMLIDGLIGIALERSMIGLTLEVRPSNLVALALYKKMGFKYEGTRPGYYADTGEDAFVMWKLLNGA